MSLDTALYYAGVGMEAVILAILFQRRIVRQLPVFSLYIGWSILLDCAGMFIQIRDPGAYLKFYTIQTPIDALLQFGVLVELAWAVLRPLRGSLPRRFILVIAILIAIAGSVVWPITSKLALHSLPPQWYMLMRLQQTFAILRVLFFLGMAASSQVLAIGWRDRELQVATGLGLYSLASLAAAVLHTHPSSAVLYHRVDQLVAASYFFSLVYWVFSFVQKEAPRQEFSPRMQSLLLSVAGAARANRLALEEIQKSPRP